MCFFFIISCCRLKLLGLLRLAAAYYAFVFMPCQRFAALPVFLPFRCYAVAYVATEVAATPPATPAAGPLPVFTRAARYACVQKMLLHVLYARSRSPLMAMFTPLFMIRYYATFSLRCFSILRYIRLLLIEIFLFRHCRYYFHAAAADATLDITRRHADD